MAVKIKINNNTSKIINNVHAVTNKAVIDIANDIVRTSSETAPHLSGDLEKSVTSDISKNADGFKVNVQYGIRGKNGFNYALKMHESSYNLGEKSARKPGGIGMSGKSYSVGKKYLQRVIDGEGDAYIKHVSKAISKVTE